MCKDASADCFDDSGLDDSSLDDSGLNSTRSFVDGLLMLYEDEVGLSVIFSNSSLEEGSGGGILYVLIVRVYFQYERSYDYSYSFKRKQAFKVTLNIQSFFQNSLFAASQ